MMKIKLFILSFLFSTVLLAQEVKIQLEEICEFKPVRNADVFLKGNGKPAIKAKFDKIQKRYILKTIPDGYDAIVAYHKKYDTEGIRKNGSFPENIKLKLQCKGNLITTDSVFGQPSQTNRYMRWVEVRDDYKILIALKDSYRKPYGEIRKTIDSLVAPYGLEYIDDLAPDVHFFKIDGNYVADFEYDWMFNLRKDEKSLENLVNEPGNYDSFKGAGYFFGTKEVSKQCYYVLPYRKKTKKSFGTYEDQTLENAKSHLPQLHFGKLFYEKFSAVLPEDSKRPWKFMACSNLKRYDKEMMNYQFIKRFGNDSTRVLFMDSMFNRVYLDKDGINNRGDMMVIAVPEYTFWHEFLLDRPKRDFRVQPARNYHFEMDKD